MDLTKIVSITGKPGLYKLVKQSNTRFIVESIDTGKKTSVTSSYNVSLLSNVSMYTLEEEITLKEVFHKIAEKENAGQAISHKEPEEKLHQYFGEILPNYDRSKVYHSDLKKLFQWYNILQRAGLIDTADKKDKQINTEQAEEQTKKIAN